MQCLERPRCTSGRQGALRRAAFTRAPAGPRQVLLQQLRCEKEFVEKENQQLRHPEAKTAKVTVWLDLQRTCQAEVQLGESDDILAVAAAVSRAHALDAAEGRALLEQLQRSYLALRTASAWSASTKSAPAHQASGGGASSAWAASWEGAASTPASSSTAFAQSGAFDAAFDAFDPDAPGGDAAEGPAQQQQQQPQQPPQQQHQQTSTNHQQ